MGQSRNQRDDARERIRLARTHAGAAKKETQAPAVHAAKTARRGTRVRSSLGRRTEARHGLKKENILDRAFGGAEF